jgi:putative transposase
VREFTTLCKLCHISKTMFDVGLDVVQQYYLAEYPHLAYKSVYHQVKSNENYELLSHDIAQQTLNVVDRAFKSHDIAQQTLNVVDRAFKSFVKFIEAVCDCLYFPTVNTPYYLPQRGYFMLMIPRIRVKDSFFDGSMSPTFRTKYGEVRIPFPKRLVSKIVKAVRIIPRYEARFFKIEFIIIHADGKGVANILKKVTTIWISKEWLGGF